MNAVDAMRVAPSVTRMAERINGAVSASSPVTRRAALAAAATSLLLAASSSLPLVRQLSLVAVGLAFVTAALVDLHERRIPNQLLVVALVAAVAGVVAPLDARALAGAAFGGLAAGGLLLAVRLARGLGMGDVKMAAVAGLSLGASAWWAGPALVAVTALGASVAGLMTRRSALPLAPAIWLGWATVLLTTGTEWWS